MIIEKVNPGISTCDGTLAGAGCADPPERVSAHDHPGPRKGLRLTVYRAAGRPDCTLGGITSTAENLTVTTIREISSSRAATDRPVPADCRVSLPEPGAPEVTLIIRHRPGGARWVHLQPAANPGRHYMHGGNYAGTGDSRWEPLAGADLIAVHDRHEG